MIIEDLIPLDSTQIEDRSKRLLTHFDKNYFKKEIRATPLLEVVKFLEKENGIQFNFTGNLGFNDRGFRVLGACNPIKRIILIDSLLSSNQHRFNFTLAHELGHLALHRKLTIKHDEINKERYEETVKEAPSIPRKLRAGVEWMEWQANCYASSLLMPSGFFKKKLLIIQNELGISKLGVIFVDDQPCNKKTFYQIIHLLSDFFQVSKMAIEYRLKRFNLIDDRRSSF